jgi:hypothetical protein
MSLLLIAFYNLRPNPSFKKNMVNGTSLETIAESFINSDAGDTIPEQSEINLEITRIQNEDMPKLSACKNLNVTTKECVIFILHLYNKIENNIEIPNEIKTKLGFLLNKKNEAGI